jgi:secreted trypsin-like serine protease
MLLKKEVTLVSLESCIQTYTTSGGIRSLPNYIQPGHICSVEEVENHKCVGDSGAPIQTIVKHQHHIIGFPSFGSPREFSVPDDNARVSFYLDWIESIVWP